MSRLQHLLSGYLRYMQISQKSLFIFIEGHKDRYIYSKIADSECDRSTVYEIATAEELPVNGSGKQALLNFFNYIKRRSFLINMFKDKATVSIFFLDKDVDDFLRIKRRSRHIVYTEPYELENYLFMYGELSEAAAASVSLEVITIKAGLGGYAEWRKQVAETWKDWVKLCLFSHSRKINSCNFSRPSSPINDRIYGPVKPNDYNLHLSNIQAQSGLSPDKFKRSFTRLSYKVNKIYRLGNYDLIFKGKWYARFLVKDIKKIASPRRINVQGLEERLKSVLALNLSFNDDWADHFRIPIRQLLEEARI